MFNISITEEFLREPSREEKIVMKKLDEKIKWAKDMMTEGEVFFADLLDEHVRLQYHKILERSLSL